MKRVVYPDLNDLRPMVSTASSTPALLMSVIDVGTSGDMWQVKMEVMACVSSPGEELEEVTAEISATFTNYQGTVTMARLQKSFSEVGLMGCDVDFNINGTAVEVMVTGQNGKGIDWCGRGSAWTAAVL